MSHGLAGRRSATPRRRDGVCMRVPGNPRIVLMLRALGLGDFLTGVPAYRALRAAYPDACLVLAAPRGLAPLARLTGAIDRVHDTHGLAPLRWSGPPPDVAVNLHGRGPHSHQVLAALGPARLLGFPPD